MIEESFFHLGVLTVSIHIPMSQSLKDKRMILKSLKDRMRSQFNVSVAEIGEHNKWQVSHLGFVMLNRDQKHIDASFQHLLSFLESADNFNLCEHKIEFI